MKINIKLYAYLRIRAPGITKLGIGESFSLSLQDNSDVKDVLKELKIPEKR